MSYGPFEITRRKVNNRTATIKVVELYYQDDIVMPENLRRGDVFVRTVKVLFPWNLKKAVSRSMLKLTEELKSTSVQFYTVENRSGIQKGGNRK